VRVDGGPGFRTLAGRAARSRAGVTPGNHPEGRSRPARPGSGGPAGPDAGPREVPAAGRPGNMRAGQEMTTRIPEMLEGGPSGRAEGTAGMNKEEPKTEDQKVYCRVHGMEPCRCDGRHLQDKGGES